MACVARPSKESVSLSGRYVKRFAHVFSKSVFPKKQSSADLVSKQAHITKRDETIETMMKTVARWKK
jgi:hypothetical protein